VKHQLVVMTIQRMSEFHSKLAEKEFRNIVVLGRTSGLPHVK